jgi:hypothetical protein
VQELIDGKRIEAVEQKVVQKASGSRKQFKRMSAPRQISTHSNSGAEYLFAKFHFMAGAYFSTSVADAVAETETSRQNPQFFPHVIISAKSPCREVMLHLDALRFILHFLDS